MKRASSQRVAIASNSAAVTGGEVKLGNSMTLGHTTNSAGTYQLSGGTLSVSTNIDLGYNVGATGIMVAGSDEQKGELLPLVAGGELLLALALEESPHQGR